MIRASIRIWWRTLMIVPAIIQAAVIFRRQEQDTAECKAKKEAERVDRLKNPSNYPPEAS